MERNRDGDEQGCREVVMEKRMGIEEGGWRGGGMERGRDGIEGWR